MIERTAVFCIFYVVLFPMFEYLNVSLIEVIDFLLSAVPFLVYSAWVVLHCSLLRWKVILLPWNLFPYELYSCEIFTLKWCSVTECLLAILILEPRQLLWWILSPFQLLNQFCLDPEYTQKPMMIFFFCMKTTRCFSLCFGTQFRALLDSMNPLQAKMHCQHCFYSSLLIWEALFNSCTICTWFFRSYYVLATWNWYSIRSILFPNKCLLTKVYF